jgi:predicted phosphodiesterase
MLGTTQPDIVVSDQHFPFENKVCIKLSRQFTRDIQPGRLHLLGDILDNYSISRFSRDPTRKIRLQGEIDSAAQYLEDCRDDAPDADLIYSEGNHENRLTRYLHSEAKELADLRALELPSLLGLKALNIRYQPASKPYKIGHLLFTHGDIVRKHSGMSACAHLEKYGCSVIHGHTHRMGSYFRTTRASIHGGFENGCLCAPPTYMSEPNWQRGFSVIHWDGPKFHVEQVPIIRNKYVYQGREYGIATADQTNGRYLVRKTNGLSKVDTRDSSQAEKKITTSISGIRKSRSGPGAERRRVPTSGVARKQAILDKNRKTPKRPAG